MLRLLLTEMHSPRGTEESSKQGKVTLKSRIHRVCVCVYIYIKKKQPITIYVLILPLMSLWNE